jgi:hypothetical protein
VPVAPERLRRRDEVWKQEIDVELDAHELRQAPGDVRIAGEIPVNLERERDHRQQHVQAGRRRRRPEHRIDERRQVVGDEHLLEHAPRDEPAAFDHLRGGDHARPRDLGQEQRRAQNRAGDQVRKIGHEQRELDQVRGRRDLAAIHVDDVADRHERVERDADRQNDVDRDRIEPPPERGKHRREPAREEVEVLEEPQHAEVEHEARDERHPSPPHVAGAAEVAPDRVVHDRRAEEQAEIPPVPRRVEVVAREQQEDVLGAMRQQPVERVDDEKEPDEMQRVEDHQRAAAARPLVSRNSKSAAATMSWPRRVRWMFSW